MKYEEVGSAAACDEILDELPTTFSNFIQDLDEEYKCRGAKYVAEIADLEANLEKYKRIQCQVAEEKKRLKAKALEMEKQSDVDTSYFFYSGKELNDELVYLKSVIKYAKSKIHLYELLCRISWNESKAAGIIKQTKKQFDLSGLTVFDQVNTLWELI